MPRSRSIFCGAEMNEWLYESKPECAMPEFDLVIFAAHDPIEEDPNGTAAAVALRAGDAGPARRPGRPVGGSGEGLALRLAPRLTSSESQTASLAPRSRAKSGHYSFECDWSQRYGP
jgi:hypothetical protein